MVKIADHAAVIYGTHFPNRVFVGCLPPKAAAQDLADFFSNFGSVSEAKVVLDENGNSRRFGFVSFSSQDGVDAVLGQGSIFFLGKKINVGPAVKKKFVDDVKGTPATLVFDQETLKAGGKSRVTYQPITQAAVKTSPVIPIHPEVSQQFCTAYMCPSILPPYNPIIHSTNAPSPLLREPFNQAPKSVSPTTDALSSPNDFQYPMCSYTLSPSLGPSNMQYFNAPDAYTVNTSASQVIPPVTSTTRGNICPALRKVSPPIMTTYPTTIYQRRNEIRPKFVHVGLRDLQRQN